jgi:hypothetical protein
MKILQYILLIIVIAIVAFLFLFGIMNINYEMLYTTVLWVMAFGLYKWAVKLIKN